MKKLAMAIVAMLMTITANAQFEAGKMYCGASLSGIDLSYNGLKELELGVNAKAGYFLDDNLLATAQVGLDTQKDLTAFSVGVGGRYYIVQNGLYLGANVNFKHAKSYNDVMPGIEIGYAFFINKNITIEPAFYYDQSFKKHSDYSTVGLRVGIGVYL